MSGFRDKVQKMMSVDEERSNKCRNVEDISSSMSDTSKKNNDDQLKILNEKVDILTVKNEKFYDQVIQDNAKFLECLEYLCFRIKFLEKNIEYDNFMNNSFIKLLAKHQSLCGVLSSKAKEVLFTYFGADALLPINTSSSPQKITEWKANPSVAECYNKLFNKERNSDLLAKILRKVFAGENPSSLHIAFVTATFAVLLDLKFKTICTNENVMRNKIDYFMKKLKDTDHLDYFKKV
ncbi:hypothetical protein C1645_735095 [Glomus cerebriforme]|uniref:Uncharacterized protein n=1 Tax=Glomus cerebriforme TaxID=658196 RepID=A0A397T6N2_9GLOM|nr:hypothetical protein C1645_735095 [Glomus cerebriforme]